MIGGKYSLYGSIVGFFTGIIFLIISQPIIGLYILAIGTLISSLWRLASGLKNAKN